MDHKPSARLPAVRMVGPATGQCLGHGWRWLSGIWVCFHSPIVIRILQNRTQTRSSSQPQQTHRQVFHEQKKPRETGLLWKGGPGEMRAADRDLLLISSWLPSSETTAPESSIVPTPDKEHPRAVHLLCLHLWAQPSHQSPLFTPVFLSQQGQVQGAPRFCRQ